jgi:hypothetical protein
MPKKEHVHVVTDPEHKQALENLGKTYGSMTKAFEAAIDTLESGKTICDECSIKLGVEQAEKFRELLNTITFTGDNIQELSDYFRGELSARELLIRSRQKAYEFGKRYNSFVITPRENTYENLLINIEEYKQRTRLLKTIEVDKFSKKIVARVNEVFKNLPILVSMPLVGFMEALGFTFDSDIDLSQADIIFKWLDPKIYALEKGKIEEKILTSVEDSDQHFKPFLFKKGMILITPDLLDWFIQNQFDYHLIPSEISYTLANLAIEIKNKDDPEELARTCIDTIKALNFSDNIIKEINTEKKAFILSISCRKPNFTKLVFNGVVQILAKFGWKLKQHQFDYRTLHVSFYYVGDDDPTILEPYYVANFVAYQNQQIEMLRIVSEDEFEELTRGLYEKDPDGFREIFHKQGVKIANAIRQLANNDLVKIRSIAIQVIPQLLRTMPKHGNISPFIDKNSFTLLFKKMDLVTMEQLSCLLTAIFDTFGYLEVKSKIIGNKIVVDFVRPPELEKKLQKSKAAGSA